MNIFFIIAASYICHNGNLQIGVIITNDFANLVILSKLPWAISIHVKHLFISAITKLHIVYACFYICFVQIMDKFICKIKIIYQTTITNCCVQHFNVRTKR